MEPKLKFFITIGIAIVLLAAFFWATGTISKLTGHAITGSAIVTENVSYNDLAKCLTEKGAKMYGAYWCSHCQNQKAEFGDSFQYINYFECDPAGENANPQACEQAGISGYPTWIINGQQYPGEQSFDKLKNLAGC